MSSNLNTYNITNDQSLLINILNTMYNNNLRQINNLVDMLNNLHNSNDEIRNLLIQILTLNDNNINNTRNSRRYNDNRRNRYYSYRDNNQRIYTTPYLIDATFNTIDNISNPSFINTDRRDNMITQLLQNFLQPVNVYPSQTQIETATRRVRYNDIVSPRNTSCPISMEEFNDNDYVTVIRHCGHIFLPDHLNNWFRNNCRCPVCRYDIRDYNSNASTEFFNSLRDSNNNNSNSNNSNSNNNSNENNYSNNINTDLTRNTINSLFDNLNFNDISTLLDLSGNTNNNNDTSSLAFILFNSLNNRRN